MIAIFELSVGNSPLSIPSDRTILFYGVPAVIVIPAGLAIYQWYRKRVQSSSLIELEDEKKFDRPSIKNRPDEKKQTVIIKVNTHSIQIKFLKL